MDAFHHFISLSALGVRRQNMDDKMRLQFETELVDKRRFVVVDPAGKSGCQDKDTFSGWGSHCFSRGVHPFDESCSLSSRVGLIRSTLRRSKRIWQICSDIKLIIKIITQDINNKALILVKRPSVMYEWM
jgi:hypothetical protein